MKMKCPNHVVWGEEGGEGAIPNMEPMGSGDYICPECGYAYFCTWNDLEEDEND